MMRTTLTLDPDLAALLKARAAETGQSFKDVVNATLRAGLDQLATEGEPLPPARVVPFCTTALLLPGVPAGELLTMLDEEDMGAR